MGSAIPYPSNRILEANTSYLLEFTSIGGQDIAARLEFYEGGLDLPLNQ